MPNKQYLPVEIAIMSGTGLDQLDKLNNVEQITMNTPFGSQSAPIIACDYFGTRVAFLARHGRYHELPPHNVPYRANLWALKQLGVKYVLSPCAVGSLQEHIKPGHIVLCDQFIDFTKSRHNTFYDKDQVYHVSLADPFCHHLRQLAISTAKTLDFEFHETGTYICIEGPRFSTRAESRFFQESMKADVIGMTMATECALARELELCYLAIATSTDYDCWRGTPVSAKMVEDSMKTSIKNVQRLLEKLVPKIPKNQTRTCACSHALKNACQTLNKDSAQR
ncbi:MAG: methylthioadenosine phosphorylase [Gammaproteobacteria bacterium RIFCSPHIGHO2_02_FULL_42_13]|nr:MAG: methylthioadenosine phosphorylase [Gammaproteobacteria bacterium RIFCSPHIGHO2_02_FULL_42_13]OGT67823.1 MAG: methylthioadenosine phosphorylase [Gammaproteobacteria bacterium RIFCSPLOWO2_02_FULL_42_9]